MPLGFTELRNPQRKSCDGVYPCNLDASFATKFDTQCIATTVPCYVASLLSVSLCVMLANRQGFLNLKSETFR